VCDFVVDHTQQSASSVGPKTIGAGEIGIEFGRFGIIFFERTILHIYLLYYMYNIFFLLSIRLMW
jgi:hypothetical protein